MEDLTTGLKSRQKGGQWEDSTLYGLTGGNDRRRRRRCKCKPIKMGDKNEGKHRLSGPLLQQIRKTLFAKAGDGRRGTKGRFCTKSFMAEARYGIGGTIKSLRKRGVCTGGKWTESRVLT